VVILLSVSFGAGYGWTCRGSTECQPSSLLANDITLQSDVQLFQTIGGPNASRLSKYVSTVTQYTIAINVARKRGHTLQSCKDEALDRAQSSWADSTALAAVLAPNANGYVTGTSAAIVEASSGKDVVYVYFTIYFVGSGSIDSYLPDILTAFGTPALSSGIPAHIAASEGASQPTITHAQGFVDETAAVGDPHLQNIHGERFDLMKSGEHVLIHLPRRESLENALLHVQAVAQTLGHFCTDTYFVRINVTGKWPSALRPGGFIFHADDPDTDAASGWMRLQGSSNGLQMKVVHAHTQQGIRYLNFYIKHLDRIGFPVGGLLGEDDHEEVSTLPHNCEQRMALKASTNTA